MQKASFLSSVRIKVCFDMDCFNSSILMENAGKRSGWKCGENILRRLLYSFYTEWYHCEYAQWRKVRQMRRKHLEMLLPGVSVFTECHLQDDWSLANTILTWADHHICISSSSGPNCKKITKCTKLGIWERCTHGVGVHGSLPRALFTRKNVKNLPKIYSRQDIAQMKSTEA